MSQLYTTRPTQIVSTLLSVNAARRLYFRSVYRYRRSDSLISFLMWKKQRVEHSDVQTTKPDLAASGFVYDLNQTQMHFFTLLTTIEFWGIPHILLVAAHSNTSDSGCRSPFFFASTAFSSHRLDSSCRLQQHRNKCGWGRGAPAASLAGLADREQTIPADV